MAGLAWLGWSGPDSALEIASRTLNSHRLGLASASPRPLLELATFYPRPRPWDPPLSYRLDVASLRHRFSLASASHRTRLGTFLPQTRSPLLSSRLGLASFRQTRPDLGLASAAPRPRVVTASPRCRHGQDSVPHRLISPRPSFGVANASPRPHHTATARSYLSLFSDSP